MRAGRIETYCHGDSTTAHKGGAMAAVLCDTDFGARTDAFIAFARRAVKMAYASGHSDWETVASLFPNVEEERVNLSRELREQVRVTDITLLSL